MDESFNVFYRTLDRNIFKYFLKDGCFYIYNSDLDYLPTELKPKSTKSNFIKLSSIDSVIKELLVTKKIPVEEYCEYKCTKRGFPGNFGSFLDICIDDNITPTVFSVILLENSIIDLSFISDSKIYNCKFNDDDLLSNLFSLCNSKNCIEIIYNNPALVRIFNSWGISCIESKYKNSIEMLKKYMKIDFEVISYQKEDSCCVNLSDFDLVDFGLVTQQGKRLLNQWLSSPCLNQSEIEKRLNFVEIFSKINISVAKFTDLKRIVAKICNRSINIQEIIKLAQTLDNINELISSFDTFRGIESIRDSFITPLLNLKSLFLPVIHQIKQTVDFNSSQIFIHLSEDLKRLQIEKSEILKEVEKEFLKVKIDYPKVSFSNKHFKISRLEYNQSDFDSKKYVIGSMLKTGVLFITKTLSILNEKIIIIENEIKKIEIQIIGSLINTLLNFTNSFESFNYLISLIDIYKAFSLKVSSNMYSKPKFSSERYEIEDMHHPILENRDCIVNSIKFTKNTCILTGPNMGGKSTFLKTLGMVSLYAQIGCYVPAKLAILPIFDKIFFRIGAKDCTSKKLSTFMVEMNELNRIVRSSTRNSLILIDELGRGTSAVDGLSLALSVRDYLIRFGSKVVMATHFSELGNEETMNKKIQVDGNILTYKVIDGVCDLSFGINVAEMAKFPVQVLNEAKKYLG